jgi:hypothetical protein
MRSAQGEVQARWIAVAGVALVHLALLAVLMRPPLAIDFARLPLSSRTQLAFIVRPVPAPDRPWQPARAAPVPAARRTQRAAATTRAASIAAPTPEPASGVAPVERAAAAGAHAYPGYAELLRQGQAAARAGNSSLPAADPFADRSARLPGGANGGRFVIRDAPTPADVAARIGRIFGGEPAGAPCRRITARITALASQVDAASRRDLERDIDLERRRCRP